MKELLSKLVERVRRKVRPYLGGVIPFAGRVLVPCNEYGEPVDGEEAEYVAFETCAFATAWLGFYVALAYGNVMPRGVDPNDPKRYAPGDVF